MRIKKVSETTPTMASVINTHSNSTTDTYSCNYLNDLQPKILWENSNIDANFSPQNITLSSGDYDALSIIWKSQTSVQYGYFFSGGIIPYNSIPSGRNLIGVYSNFFRTYQYNSKTQIHFDDGVQGETTVKNNFMIPVCVIGYKMN